MTIKPYFFDTFGPNSYFTIEQPKKSDNPNSNWIVCWNWPLPLLSFLAKNSKNSSPKRWQSKCRHNTNSTAPLCHGINEWTILGRFWTTMCEIYICENSAKGGAHEEKPKFVEELFGKKSQIRNAFWRWHHIRATIQQSFPVFFDNRELLMLKANIGSWLIW